MRSTSAFWFSGAAVVIVFLSMVAATDAGGREKRFIGWEDLEVQLREGDSDRDGSNGTRIIVVDKNGSGDSRTVQGAVDMVPRWNTQRVKIYILPGIYREKVFIPRTKPYISFIGNDRRASNTVITWNDKASDKDSAGKEIGTWATAAVSIESDYFCARGITIQNSVTAEPGDSGRQAVALRISADKAVFYKVRFIGSQDTLLDDVGSHYYYRCFIQGSVDFIFGTARSLFENCLISSTAENYGAIAAHHRDSPNDDSGFSFVHCLITGSGKILLGRAWGRYSRIIYSYCDIQDVIDPTGWSDWEEPSRQRTAVFGLYQCRGDGAQTDGWVPWAKSFSYQDVRRFLDTNFIDGHQWLNL